MPCHACRATSIERGIDWYQKAIARILHESGNFNEYCCCSAFQAMDLSLLYVELLKNQHCGEHSDGHEEMMQRIGASSSGLVLQRIGIGT